MVAIYRLIPIFVMEPKFTLMDVVREEETASEVNREQDRRDNDNGPPYVNNARRITGDHPLGRLYPQLSQSLYGSEYGSEIPDVLVIQK